MHPPGFCNKYSIVDDKHVVCRSETASIGGSEEGNRFVVGLTEIVAGFGGQGEVEGGSLIENAGGPDAASVLLDNAATDG